MKRYILIIGFLSIPGIFLSLALLVQHYFPASDLGIISCGGFENPCVILNQSPYSTLFGIPIAAYGLFFYILLFITSLITFFAGSRFYYHSLAILLPLSVLSLAADLVLGIILIVVSLSCRLCIATYSINVLILVVLIFWYRTAAREGKAFRVLFRELLLFRRNSEGKAAAAAFVLIVIILFVSTLSGSYILKLRSAKSEVTRKKIESFMDYFYSQRQEDLSDITGSLTIGEPDAEIQIIVFTDFLCSACYRFYENEKYLLSRFRGKIRIEYINFPLDRVCNEQAPRTVYSNSCVISRSFLVASQLGLFKEFLVSHYDNYRQNHSRLASGDVMVSITDFFGSREEGIPGIMKRINSNEINTLLERDINAGKTMNIRAAPTLFINSRRLEGVPPVEMMEAVIENELAREELEAKKMENSDIFCYY